MRAPAVYSTFKGGLVSMALNHTYMLLFELFFFTSIIVNAVYYNTTRLYQFHSMKNIYIFLQ